MELELRHLRIVCAVAEAGSVTKAAAVLGLAQPAVTAQLRRIERSLGGELFDRGRHGVTPTALGELVLTRARVLLPAARELHDDAMRLAAAERAKAKSPTRLRIGTSGGPYLAGMVRRLSDRSPAVEVNTTASFSSYELLDALRADRLDCAVIGCCGEDPLTNVADLIVHRVAVEPVWVMLSESHQAATLSEVPLSELSDDQWAWLPGDGCLYECFVSACVRQGFTPRTGFESDAATCMEMSRMGRAVALCLPIRKAPGVVVKPLAGTPLRWIQAMVWRDEASARQWYDQLAPAAAAAYNDLVADSPAYRQWLDGQLGFGAVDDGR